MHELLAVILGLAGTLSGQTGSGARGCTECHGTTSSSPAPLEVLTRSVHRTLDCVSCHESLSLEHVDSSADRPHGAEVASVRCGECHEEAADAYVQHGRHAIGADPDLPTCSSCHGTHDILAAEDPLSRVHPVNLPDTCRACHTDVNLIKKHDLLRQEPIELYESSVHARASRRGLYVAATCNDCHSAADGDGRRTAHRILSAGDPNSSIHHFNIPKTCGRCHEGVTRDFWDGIHGQRVAAGRVDAPVCTHCHGEHGIISPSDPRSPVSAARVAESTCAPCHESQVLNEKYGVPAGRLRTYIDSFHGLKSKAGDVHVANCASCHGAHRILPHSDATSSIHPDNLRKTCGECHPGISAELAGAPIHETATGIYTGWPHFFTVFYMWMIGVTVGLMVIHNMADWFRKVRRMRLQPFVIRMTAGETMQHWVLMVSFVVLVISGFSLRFSEAWWVQLLFGWGGGQGFLIRGTVHRVAGVVFILYTVWHVVYLFTQRGRRWIRDMLLSRRDFANIRENILFFLGRREELPSFGRFSYMEKCEYWALAWGALIMIGTGIPLWFEDYFVQHWGIPQGLLTVLSVIHYYEAWLATLAIVVWHLYSTVFNPGVYPMNPSWLGGRMPRDMYVHEHPEGPKLKARVYRAHYEDEEEASARPHRGTPSSDQSGGGGGATPDSRGEPRSDHAGP